MTIQLKEWHQGHGGMGSGSAKITKIPASSGCASGQLRRFCAALERAGIVVDLEQGKALNCEGTWERIKDLTIPSTLKRPQVLEKQVEEPHRPPAPDKVKRSVDEEGVRVEVHVEGMVYLFYSDESFKQWLMWRGDI